MPIFRTRYERENSDKVWRFTEPDLTDSNLLCYPLFREIADQLATAESDLFRPFSAVAILVVLQCFHQNRLSENPMRMGDNYRKGSMKNMLVSGMGLAMSIVQGLMKYATEKGLSHIDIQWLARQHDPAVCAVLEKMTEKMVGVLEIELAKIGRVFNIIRGGKRTTEEVVRATTHTFVNGNINSANFPLTRAAEEGWELEAFQVADWDHDPSSEEILQELKTRKLERPTYEDALKFDEEHTDKKGTFVFLHRPWLGPDGLPDVLVVRRDEADRGLYLNWFAGRWYRGCWFVGVRPRK